MHRLQQKVLGKVKLLGLKDSLPATVGKAAQVIFVHKPSNEEALKAALPFPVSNEVLADFKGNAKETLLLYPKDGQRTLLVGLGDAIDEVSLRDATHEALANLKSRGVRHAFLRAPTVDSLSAQRVAELVAQTSVLSNYEFNRHLSAPEDTSVEEKLPLTDIFVQASTSSLDEDASSVAEKLSVAEETLFARNLGNERSDVVDTAFVEQVAVASAADLPNLHVTVLQDADLRSKGLNMMALVGQAGACPPRLVILEYRGNPSTPDDRIALVGKVRPTASTPIGQFESNGLRVNVVAALALAENAIGSKAAKPHTIVKSLKGLSVEVNNTDAEGRLVLADTLTYVQQQYKPHTVIDVATLTGACVVALGEYSAGLFSNADDLAHDLLEAGSVTHERCWRLPIFAEHSAELKGHQSDSRSTGTVLTTQTWPAMYSAARSYFPKGATGFGVQVLFEYLKKAQQKHV
ncbi:hypothetical protein DYB28_002929 [Aphanomyces astaci]|uniref:Cytosol aminopeptidase domain-containing protein n=1 Tax=Aphanomyces astaci TaxID=112090 RepID=A0A9X8DIF0_APHAT|nr:hypothetical protein DYB28_002929 [Aphanomyces astaci]